MDKQVSLSLQAEPYEFAFEPGRCAFDMQRDFLEPDGFGEMLGNDVSQLRRTIEPNRRLLTAWRKAGLQVIDTREGHRADLTDLPPAKKVRGRSKTCIGDLGPMGRIQVRGEAGHDIIPELYPLPTEPVIDKPGKGALRVLRVRDEHPGEPVDAQQAVAVRAEDARRIVFKRILPATGLMMCLSTMYYAWLAYPLAKKAGRDDAMLFGLHTARHRRRAGRGRAGAGAFAI